MVWRGLRGRVGKVGGMGGDVDVEGAVVGGAGRVEVDMVARRVRRAGMERARRAVVGREGRRRGIIWWILG